ncbi:CYTH-like domain-containing protein [Leucosporidium creatinivorum]|uniref:mRNA-capping enzyme subunit beta n=1 Tax=Leucosporidium creatinivorum TaxID=106004 RepID=A0A1Y2DP25_9BASI|nr:CYTH-like domain-containing protein [Leucosporidium creatinivorum]
MTINQHKSFNHLLNSRVEEAAHPEYKDAVVRYMHTREVDSFHDVPSPTGSGPKRKVRVTRDQKDPSKVLRVVEKTRIADMNIFSPKRLFDWRISVSVEVPEPSLPPTPSLLTRSKDRISYSHQLFTVDLTQVSQPATPDQQGKPTLHELEIEFKDARVLLAEAAKEERGEENQYLEMVQVFLNNVRMLIRNASDP